MIALAFSLPAAAEYIRQSDESEKALQRFQSVVSSEKIKLVDATDERCVRVNTIGQLIATQSRRPIPWVFYVVQDKSANAACTGEGLVYVTTGLLQLGLTDDELAGVLAHEVAHGARQHLAAQGVQRSRENRTRQEAREASKKWDLAQREYQEKMSSINSNSNGSSNSGSLDKIMAADDLAWKRSQAEKAARSIQSQIQQHQSYHQFEGAFNRYQENEADAAGVRYAAMAGYQPEGLMNALTKLQAHNVTHYGQVSKLGSRTHPPIEQRIEHLNRILTQRTW